MEKRCYSRGSQDWKGGKHKHFRINRNQFTTLYNQHHSMHYTKRLIIAYWCKRFVSISVYCCVQSLCTHSIVVFVCMFVWVWCLDAEGEQHQRAPVSNVRTYSTMQIWNVAEIPFYLSPSPHLKRWKFTPQFVHGVDSFMLSLWLDCIFFLLGFGEFWW